MVLCYKTEKRTSRDLEERYMQAKKGRADTERLIINMKQKVKDTHEKVCTEFNKIQHCLKRLEEMELSPHPLTNLEFVNVLIESEKQEARPRWEERIVFYGKAKISAEVNHHAKKGKYPKIRILR